MIFFTLSYVIYFLPVLFVLAYEILYAIFLIVFSLFYRLFLKYQKYIFLSLELCFSNITTARQLKYLFSKQTDWLELMIDIFALNHRQMVHFTQKMEVFYKIELGNRRGNVELNPEVTGIANRGIRSEIQCDGHLDQPIDFNQ